MLLADVCSSCEHSSEQENTELLYKVIIIDMSYLYTLSSWFGEQQEEHILSLEIKEMHQCSLQCGEAHFSTHQIVKRG